MTITYTLSELSRVAEKIIKTAKHKTLLFYGEMGTGKTTLIKELVKQLGYKGVVNSPTFSLVNEYETELGELIYHFDFYRLEDENEALDIGVEEYFDTDNYSLIEWPQKIINLIPKNSTYIYLAKNDDQSRTIVLEQS